MVGCCFLWEFQVPDDDDYEAYVLWRKDDYGIWPNSLDEEASRGAVDSDGEQRGAAD
jgi:hypothetical protein